jgi:hypothetical protein
VGTIVVPHGEEALRGKVYAGYACCDAVSNHEATMNEASSFETRKRAPQDEAIGGFPLARKKKTKGVSNA